MLNRDFYPASLLIPTKIFWQNFAIRYPRHFNFAVDVVDAWAEEQPDKPALVWCNDAGDERRLSFDDIAPESARKACVLRDMGVGHGDVVLLLLKRRWQFWILAPALMRLGAIFIPATIQLTKKDLIYRCNVGFGQSCHHDHRTGHYGGAQKPCRNAQRSQPLPISPASQTRKPLSQSLHRPRAGLT